jgi:hypothetical protein
MDLVPFDSSDLDVSALLAQSQQQLAQSLVTTQLIQQALQQRMVRLESRADIQSQEVASLKRDVHKLCSDSALVTVIQLETMLGVSWSETERNLTGRALAKFSRGKHVEPVKVPHPVIPGGVNAYEPSVVREYLECCTDYPIPSHLSLV